MRAFKFLDARFGLKSLYERRLKQSRLHELNDPFELRPYDVTDSSIRHAFLKTRSDIGENRGMVCFSADWSDPVIWAHYSDKHRGLCLGFEIPTILGDPDNDESGYVSYIRDPLSFPPNLEDLPDDDRFAIVRKILFTKFKHWEYEKEIRVWAPLQHEEGRLHYLEFDEKMRLTEIVIGQECQVSRAAIARALGSLSEKIKITRARAAYDRFEMVEDDEQE